MIGKLGEKYSVLVCDFRFLLGINKSGGNITWDEKLYISELAC